MGEMVEKRAVEALARSWADETKNYPLRINCVDPGATRTAMRAQAMPGEDPMTLPHPEEVAAKIVFLASPSLTQTGMIYQVRNDQMGSYRLPELSVLLIRSTTSAGAPGRGRTRRSRGRETSPNRRKS